MKCDKSFDIDMNENRANILGVGVRFYNYWKYQILPVGFLSVVEPEYGVQNSNLYRMIRQIIKDDKRHTFWEYLVEDRDSYLYDEALRRLNNISSS